DQTDAIPDVSLSHAQVGKMSVRLGVRWRQRDRRAKGFFSLRILVPETKHHALIVPQDRVFGLRGDGATNDLLGQVGVRSLTAFQACSANLRARRRSFSFCFLAVMRSSSEFGLRAHVGLRWSVTCLKILEHKFFAVRLESGAAQAGPEMPN